MKVDKARGMNISVVTTAKTDEESRKLLAAARDAIRAVLTKTALGTADGDDQRKIAEGSSKNRQSSRSACGNRCKRCGRPRAYMRKFALCRLVLPQAGARTATSPA